MKTRVREAKCRYCGKPILVIQSNTGKWVSCEPVEESFEPCSGRDITDTFVIDDGRIYGGTLRGGGSMKGYRKHQKLCKA
jgi:hypothetical protein